jgi:DNA-binding SARP family transcriptional activator
MARLRLRAFGGLSLEGADGAEVTLVKGRRPLALLTLIASAGPRGLSRDKATALLWPESDAERGRNSLSQVLSALRRDLALDDLAFGTTELRVSSDALGSDVAEFEACVAKGDFGRAAALHAGPFLDGFYLTDAPEFERWVEGERARLSEKQCDALRQLASDADRRGDHPNAILWWRRLAALDPTSSRATVGLMAALAASGDIATALRHSKVYSKLLEQEFHAEPDAAVVQLAERLRRGNGVTRDMTSPPSTAGGVRATAPTSNAAPAVAIDTNARLRPRADRRPLSALIAIALLIGTFTTIWAARAGPFATLRRAGKLHPHELLLVADFNVNGPDSALSAPLAQMMRSGLGASSVIEIVPQSRIAGALERMARAPESRVDVGLARDVAQREGIKAIVGGTLTSLSGERGYLLSTVLLVASTGDELASFQEPVDDIKNLIPAVDRLSRKLRERIGESLSAVRADPPLADVTTASLDALKKYTEAMEANTAHRYDRAVALLEEAIALDSNFAMAYRQAVVSINNSRGARIGVGGEQSSESARMLSLSEKVYQLRNRLSERERLQAMSLYYGSVLGDREKARATYEIFLSKYPRTPGAANFYATSFLLQSREFARAESVYATAMAIDTSVPFPYSNIVGTQIAQGKLAEARQSIARLAQHFPTLSDAKRLQAQLHYALGELDSAELILRGVASSSNQMDRLYAVNMLTAFALLQGRVSQVGPRLKETRALAAVIGGLPLPLRDSMTMARVQLVFFNRPEVAVRMLDRTFRERRQSALEADDAPYLLVAAFYASAGRPDKAREVLALYDRDVRDSTQRRRDEHDRQIADAQLDLAEGRATTAVAKFRGADRLPSWPDQMCAVCIDVDIGRAFDRAGMRDSAIVAFEEFVNAPSWRRYLADAWNLHWVLRRLGELHQERGEREAAAKYYQKFVALWKDADPELQPAVTEVKQRLARLRN